VHQRDFGVIDAQFNQISHLCNCVDEEVCREPIAMASIKHREGLWDYDLVEKIIQMIGRNKVALAYGKYLPVMTKWNQQTF